MPWEGLKAILDVTRQEARDTAGQSPVACPIDGDILDVRIDGTRNCPMGNYTWRGGQGIRR